MGIIPLYLTAIANQNAVLYCCCELAQRSLGKRFIYEAQQTAIDGWEREKDAANEPAVR